MRVVNQLAQPYLERASRKPARASPMSSTPPSLQKVQDAPGRPERVRVDLNSVAVELREVSL